MIDLSLAMHSWRTDQSSLSYLTNKYQTRHAMTTIASRAMVLVSLSIGVLIFPAPRKHRTVSNVELFALPGDRVGIGHVSQGQELINREVAHRRHGQQTIRLLVGGDVIGPSSAVAADHVIALELAVAFELFTVLGLLHDGADHVWGQVGYIEMPQDEEIS